MSKQLRVHDLAKELNVESKDIIAKCKAEGIELKNHMAVVKLGLAESIREWFSAAADVTSVEVAQPVDLEKVVKRKPRKKAATASEQDESSVGTAVAEPPVLEEPASESALHADAEAAPTIDVDVLPVPEAMPVAPAAPETPAVEVAATASSPAVAAPVDKPAEAPAIAAKAPPQRTRELIPVPPPAPPPQAVRPAGPQVVPAPAALQGPRVVRIEAPDPVRAPRPRPPAYEPSRPGGERESVSPAARAGRSTTPVRGREDDRDILRKGTRSPRRSGRADELAGERVKEWKDQDILERKERLASATGGGLRARRTAERRRQATPGAAIAHGRKGAVEITVPIMLKDLCAAIGSPFSVVSTKLLAQTGKLHRINEMIDAETVELLALELGVPVSIQRAKTAAEKLEEEFAMRERPNLQRRPPVVCILGHVDHGKTSLLDAIRKTSVAAGEAGGITQHIGAYRIDKGDWHVTFLDTPGHEAFTAMRARGAHMTDVVVLVVAATDGVMPQTIEAMNHAKAAGVTIVVALNKIDVPSVDINKVYGQLAEHELTPTEWGGTTDVIKTSAVTGQGIDELIAHLSTLSELMDLKADPTVPALGTVIEAQMREGRGIVAQVLVREGTLKVGQFVTCGPGAGRVRSLIDDHGHRVEKAGPATPVEVVGIDELPEAGDKLFVVESLARAKEIASEVKQRRREASLAGVRKATTLEDLLRGDPGEEVPELNVILKADVQGSLESLKKLLSEFPSEKAKLRMLHTGIGMVTEADVMLAQTSRSVIIGFNIVAEDRAKQLADSVGVQIRTYRVIYEIKDDLYAALEGLLAPEQQQQLRAKLDVLQVFNISKIGVVAGCRVREGTIARSHHVRLLRDGRIIVDDAPLVSLRRVKDDVREVRAGLECGVKIEGYDDIKPGDVIEAFETVSVKQQL